RYAQLQMAAEAIERQLRRVPTGPGVYLFRNERGDVLYVGKAKSLRPRVRSYFQAGSSDTRPGIRQMSGRVETIETIVTGSEVEALHLEQNLVKRHRPPFNVRLRDDKSFPYIAVTVEDEYPRVMFTRERHRPGVWYFGPYANAKKVRETLDVLNRVFRYRPCEGPKPGRHSGIPCLDYHIDRCLAPCVGYVSQEDYRGIVDGVIEFLSGDVKPIQRELERRMQEAAAGERFEDAARYRNRLFAVQHLVERQAVERQSVGTVDVIGFAAEGERGEKRRLQRLADENALHVLTSDLAQGEQRRLRRVEALEQLRETLNLESLPLRIECFDVSTAMGQDNVGSLVVFQDGLPKKAHYRKFGIRGQEGMDDFAAMGEMVSRRVARLSAGPAAEEYDESFAATPNLVVVDGGKGQLAAALAAMQAFDLPRVAVIALAKREEEVFVPGRAKPVVLSRHDPGLQLLQRIRDEAHRFAVGFHRQRRESRGFASLFDELEGVGPARRRALLNHFGSVDAMLAATPDELEGVPGVPAKVARSVYAQLHKAGRA